MRESALQRLVRHRGEAVVSFYLDVDGRRYPRRSDYEPHVDHLFRAARNSAALQGKRVVEAIEADLECISRWLQAGIDRESTRSVAAFSCDAQGLFDTFSLPLPVHDQVVVAPGPDIAQLVTLLAVSKPALVVAIDRQSSRLLHVEFGEAEDRGGPVAQIERQIDTDVELGSFEHRHEEHTREHYRRVAAAVVKVLEQRPAKHLVLCGTEDAVAHLEDHLPRRVVALVTGRIPRVANGSQAELAHAASEVVSRAENRRKVAMFQELRERVSQQVAAAAGLAATIESIEGGRAETLFVEQGFEAEGCRCPRCDQIMVEQETCPACGMATLGIPNVVDAAITEAFAHHVALELCEARELADLGGIAALERR